ncbi:Cdc6/Cdc18 family protein [Haloferacaceae archaeon DSL9]
MNLEERIARRLRVEAEPRLIRSYEALSPVSHRDEPTACGPAVEQLLDHVEPALRGARAENLYVWGPKGTGKSAVLSALFEKLAQVVGGPQQIIQTTTRAQSPTTTFVYIDARAAKTTFGLSHAVTDALVEESIPRQGVGTSALQDRLDSWLAGGNRHAVVAVDHVGEPETHSVEEIDAHLAARSPSLTWVCIGRDDPESAAADGCATLEFEPYERHTLVEILTGRASDGLTRRALAHEQLRRVAEWADGDAHDALAAIFGAAELATTAHAETIDDDALTAGMEAVPRPCVSLGEVLSLADSRRRVLRQLLELDADERRSVRTAAAAIAARDVDLSQATIERVLYELSEAGITRRVQAERTGAVGRPPSRLEPRFPTLVFERLASSLSAGS